MPSDDVKTPPAPPPAILQLGTASHLASPDHNAKRDSLTALLNEPRLARCLTYLATALTFAFDDIKERSHMDTIPDVSPDCQNDLAMQFERLLRDLAALEEDKLPEWLSNRLPTRWNGRTLLPAQSLCAQFSTWAAEREDVTLPDALLRLIHTGIVETHSRTDEDAQSLRRESEVFLNEPMKGEVHLALLERIAKRDEGMFMRHQDGKATYPRYGRIIHVVQSSGMGKSRMANEVIKLLPGLSICFRPPSRPSIKGFPLGDDPATEFCTYQRPDSDIHRQVAATAFLACLLDRLAQETGDTTSDTTRHPSPSRFWTRWGIVNDLQNNERTQLFTDVAADATVMSRTDRTGLRYSDDGIQTLVDKHENDIASLADALVVQWCIGPAGRLADKMERASVDLDACHQLDETVKSYYLDTPTFFLVLDEANYLDSEHGIRLMHLRRTLFSLSRCQSRLRLWTLLMDTFSGITTLTCPPDSSERLRGYPPLESFSLLPLDVDVRVEAPAASANAYLDYARLKMLGRPLWNTVGTGELTWYARSKLFCGSDFRPEDINHVVAAFSHRIWLDLVCEHAVRSFADSVKAAGPSTIQGDVDTTLSSHAVRKHLRLIQHLDESGRISTMVASEPAVSLAAEEALKETPKTYGRAACTLVKDLLLRGQLLHRGNLGEFTSRFVLILARDYAIPNITREPLNPRAPSIPASDFLKVLLGDGYGLKDPAEVAQLEAHLVGAWVSFTHFLPCRQLGDSITSEKLEAMWARTAALQCHSQQSGIDGLIPVYRGDPDKPLDATRFSYIGYQSKLSMDVTLPKLVVDVTRHGSDRRCLDQLEQPMETRSPRIISVKCNVWGARVERTGDAPNERPLVIVMDQGLETDRANRLFTSVTELKDPAKVSAALSRSAKSKVADWIEHNQRDEHHSFTALHVSGFQRAYPVLDRVSPAGTMLQTTIELNRRNGLSDGPSRTLREARIEATWYPC